MMALVQGSILLSLTGSNNPCPAESRFVRNGSLNQRGSRLKDEDIRKLRENGWICPEARDWPLWWNGLGANMKVEVFTTGGKDNDSFFRISGKDGLVVGYYGDPFEVPSYVLTFWARGEGTLRAGVVAYQLSEDRQKIVGMVSLPPLEVKVRSEKWVRYRHLLRKGDMEVSVHAAFSAPEGTVDFDEVDIVPSNPVLDWSVEEEAKLYGTGALIENLDLVAADEVFRAKAQEYAAVVEALRSKAPTFDPALVEALEQEITPLEPYVRTPGVSLVQAVHYNEMLVLTRVLKRLVGEEEGQAGAIQATAASAPSIDHKPGVRPPRPDTVTITDIRSNKVRYDENETATTKATLVNTSGRAYSGTLIALMHLDLDTTREIARTAFTLGGAETKAWSFSYHVGPETYGRGIEVRFEKEAGEVVDSWQEFYAVAAEWFRVQQHTHAGQTPAYEVNPWVTYLNQRHYFACEPTDFGVHSTEVEQYLSGQAGYVIHPAARWAEIDYYRNLGIKHTFYQTFAFCGQMGYEEMRKHPEYSRPWIPSTAATRIRWNWLLLWRSARSAR